MATGRIPINGTAAIQSTIVDAKGDLIVATGADAVARLAVGTNGHTLVADSAETTGLKWATATSGGYTEIATGSIGSGASFTISSIPATYQDIVIFFNGHYPATAGANLYVYLNGDTTSKYLRRIDTTTLTDQNINESPTLNKLGDNQANTGTTDNRAIIEIPQYYRTIGIKRFWVDAITKGDGATTSWHNWQCSIIWDNTAAISSLTVIPSTGNIGGGTYTLYGVK